MKKNIVSLILALVLLVSVMVFPISAAEPPEALEPPTALEPETTSGQEDQDGLVAADPNLDLDQTVLAGAADPEDEAQADSAQTPAAPEPEEPAAPETPAEPEEPAAPETGYVTASALKVRSGPGTTYDKVGLLYYGNTVTIQEKLEGWYKITSGKLAGYVSADYIVLLDASASAANSAHVPVGSYVDVSGVKYVPVRTFMSIVDPGASVSEQNGTVCVKAASGGMALTLTAGAGNCYIEANNRCLYVAGGNRYVNGMVAVPVNVLAKVFNMDTYFAVDGASLVRRSGAAPYLADGNYYYNSDSLYWLSHIINAESGNQPLNGKIAVGNVIMNRVNDRSGNWPNTVKGVIFQKNQFSPAASGSIYKDPNAQSVIAAKLVLEGVQVLPTAKFFNATYLKNTWAARNRTYLCTIGGHAFYA